MDPVTLAIWGVTAATGALIAAFTRQRKKRIEAEERIKALMKSLNQYTNSYALEPCDEKMIDGCRKRLKKFLGGQSFKQKLEGKTMAERREELKKLVETMAEEMKVEVDHLIIDASQDGMYGYQRLDENGERTIFLNELLLAADPDHLVFTVLHELRHGVQTSSIYKDVWGFSNERKAQWMCSYANYVEGNQLTYTAYVNQIIELDANLFADTVLNPKTDNKNESL